MKIGVLIDELISGGFQKVAIMEVKYLNKLGHDAFLVVLHKTKNEGYEDLIKKNNIKIIRISDRLPFFLKLNFKFPFFAFFSFFHIFYPAFIWKYIKKDNFDCFITHGTYTVFSSIIIKRKLKIPFISFIHDSITYIIKIKYDNKFPSIVLKLLIFIAEKLDYMIISHSDAVLAFPSMIKEMRDILPTYKNYQEIYNGCETIEENEINFDKSDFIISVTKWDQGKNFDFLLNLWSKLDFKIPLKIIGSFYPLSLKEEMQKAINKSNLRDLVELVGEVTEEKLYKYYKNAKLMVHPCREAFGMTILEAAANGCPAIFTNNSGVAELFFKKIALKLPRDNNVEEYKDAINYLIMSAQKEYKKFVEDYYKVAVENSWENHCREIEKLILKSKFTYIN